MRLTQLAAADDLGVVARIPQLRLRCLSANPSVQFTVDLPPKHRLRFEALGKSGKVRRTDVDRSSVQAIRILAVEETDGD